MLFISGHGKKKDSATQRKLEAEEKAKIKAAKLRRNRNKQIK